MYKKIFLYSILSTCLSVYCFAQSDSLIVASWHTLQTNIDSLEENHPIVAKSYRELGVAYFESKDYNKCLSFFKKSIDVYTNLPGENHHLELAKSYFNAGLANTILKQFDQALIYSEKALKIRINNLGEGHIDLATSYNMLSVIYRVLGEYDKALESVTNAIDIQKSQLGHHHIELAANYSNLALIHQDIGNYETALDFNKIALDIRKKNLGEYHSDVAISYNNMAIIYSQLGDQHKALITGQKALEIKKSTLDKNSPSIANTYSNLALINKALGNYSKALELSKKSLEIRVEKLGKNNIASAVSYRDIAGIYLELNDIDKALELSQKSLDIRIKELGKKHPRTANSYDIIALVYKKSNDHKKAIEFNEKSLDIRLSKLDNNHPHVILSYVNLADSYHALQNYHTADSLWHIIINENIKRLNDTYLFLRDNQRLTYSETFEEVYNRFYSFVAKYDSEQTKQLAAYLLMNTKSLALDYSVSVSELTKNTNDEELAVLSDKLVVLNRKLSKAEFMTGPELKEQDWDLAAMRNEQDNLSDLILKNNTLKEKLYKTPVTWETIKDQLKPNEIILDFIRFYEEKDSSWMYYAMVTRHDKSAPLFVKLTDQASIVKLLTANKKTGLPNYIQNSEILQELHQKIWHPLEPYLDSINTIHFSPSGLLHQLDFETLQDNSGTYLVENFEFHRYSAIRNFAQKKPVNVLRRPKILLFGDIAFDIPIQDEQKETSELLSAGKLRAGIPLLPATAEEISAIGKINKKKRGSSIYITANAATEDTLRYYSGSQSPDILHLATHGKYLTHQSPLKEEPRLQNNLQATSNPLNRLLLMLSGANNSWTTNEYVSRSDKDGILTASEVSQLDLSNTRLVVLSACNTGLGDIHDTEGVLGLHHAFKLAGVPYVIVSLWKINDTATKDLMILFYKNLLCKKQTPYTALHQAKKSMREKGAKTEHWAGFILME